MAVKPWKMLQAGVYSATQGLAHAVIERSVRGFWWWLVCDDKGIVIKAGRELKLKAAKSEAWTVVSNHTLKLIRREF